ncbi:TonB-dependent receptor [Pseudoxanthomonas kalamensis DSM 18571]|uniref:TonB-dependent receptor n=1 Tax=Pseudoxanthomonas kalamensis TaxID=289483 RepID=UPI001391641F|nr:TonB-dependent receptor [Pseudoxanthomonas kalamensis]KAF1711284.1 TonB-dependent receptor [Pseudoxanthomonas kalamensis DSM 18571]
MTNLKKLPNAIKLALFVSAASLSTGTAFAQDSDSSGEATTLDRVEVTGSRLKRADIEGASPVIVIDRAQIDASGDVSVADVLRDSTFASFGNFKPQSGSSAQSLSTINLRGLGSGRTLVLIDGRRAPTNPMSASSGADVNAIPLAAVERIEILSDGASAVYGSDAIGGVVNIILRKDFNGAELRIGTGQTAITGGDLEDASAVFGVSGDRGRLVGGASKASRGMVFTRDQIGGETLGVSTYGNNYYDWDTGLIVAVPGFDCPSTTERNVDYPFWAQSNGRCSFDFNSVAANEASVDNTAVFVRGDYQINDDWLVYATFSNTKVETFGRYAPVPGVVIASDGTPNDVVQGDGLPTYFFHRFAAAGNRDTYTTANNADYLIGFQGQLTDKISVEFGARRTNYDYDELGYGYIIQSLANQAVDAGDYVLTDPYGASQETLNGFTATIGRNSFFKTKEWFGNATFDLFEMGGGLSSVVVGGEYREEDYMDLYDSLSQAGVVLGSAGGASAGGREVSSAYFEWLFPFTSAFDVTVAGRYDKYSDYGNDFSPKISGRWQPMDNLTFRASWGQGFRAPGLDILTQAPSFSADPVQDPASCLFNGLTADCLNNGVSDEVQVDTYYIANPGLSSEQSEQYSIGVVWDPTEWLDLSVDFWNIEIDNNISSISAQDIVNMDLDPANYGEIPPGLSITRSPVDGHITEIIAGYGNVGNLKTNGFDFRANTDFDFGAAGSLKNMLTVSYTNKYEITSPGSTIDYIGYLGTPKYRANLQNYWKLGDFGVIWGINYIDGQEDPDGTSVGGYATNDLQFNWETPWNSTISVGAMNIGDRYPELVGYDGRPWNFYLYDAYGRTTYFRYTQRF